MIGGATCCSSVACYGEHCTQCSYREENRRACRKAQKTFRVWCVTDAELLHFTSATYSLDRLWHSLLNMRISRFAVDDAASKARNFAKAATSIRNCTFPIENGTQVKLSEHVAVAS
jgi:hypothetical protein